MMTRETFRRRIFETPLIEQPFLDHVKVRSRPRSAHGLGMMINGPDLCALKPAEALYFEWDIDTSFVPGLHLDRILTGLRLECSPNVRDNCAIEVQLGHHRSVLRANIGRFAVEADKDLDLNRAFTIEPVLVHGVPVSIYLRSTCEAADVEIKKRATDQFYVHATLIGYDLPHNLVDAAKDWLK